MLKKLLLTLRIGVYSLLLHKLRTFLAMLGIMIGITAVIWLVAGGEGVSFQAQKQLADLGATNIIIRSVKPAAGGSTGGRGIQFLEYGLLRDDLKRLKAILNRDRVEQVVPMRYFNCEFRFGGRAIEGRLVGCTKEYLELNRLTMDRGRFISETDNATFPPENFCVLGDGIASALFPLENPLEHSIEILSAQKYEFYRVIGTTLNRDPTAAIGGSLEAQDFNRDVYIPIETLWARIGDAVNTSRSGGLEGEVVELNQITLTVRPAEDREETAMKVEQIADVVRGLMDKNHEKKQDVAIVVPQELLRQAELLSLMFRVLSFVIGSISLMVGGIGIMNIMLATVTERIREIGIRRALGAKRRDIISQFLVESIVLTTVGGFFGMLFGFAVKPFFGFLKDAIKVLSPSTYEALPPAISDLEPIIAPTSVIVSFGVAVMVGVAFGLYPAYRAARMDPIEALRHE
ncbi:MAG: ABC transporter permease [Planctomycetota bacterium]|nr:ABC transporter permease [Planctomycetota bacterium]